MTPSSSQVGLAPALTSDVTLKGTDRFAGVPVSASASGTTSQTQDGGNGIVVGK
jgi:hypothetical protein